MPSTSGKSSLTRVVIIPALNEVATIGSVVTQVREVSGSQVVVIDDLSSDQTAAEARAAGAVVLPLPFRLGAWGAAQTGLRYAHKYGFETAVTMDADGQHPPEAIPFLTEPIESGRAEVVIGSCTQRGSMARKAAWTVFRRMTGIEVNDLTSGFRAYNDQAIACLAASGTSLLDYQDLGVLIHLRKSGFRMVEAPVQMCSRGEGHSRIFATWWNVVRYLAYTGILCASRSR